MLDIQRRDTAALGSLPPVEFLRIQLAPLGNGEILCSLTATTVDEQEPELLDEEVACVRVRSLEEVLELIRQHVRIGVQTDAPRQAH
jgi:hypothetical protein